MSWDDDDFEIKNPLSSNTAQGSWEDDDEVPAITPAKTEAPAPAPAAPAAQGAVKPKQQKKAALKAAEEKKNQEAEVKKGFATVQVEDAFAGLTPAERKQREQALVENADFENTKDLFSAPSAGKDEEDVKNLENFVPKTVADFDLYANMLTKKFADFNLKGQQLEFLKRVAKKIVDPLKSDEIKDVVSTLNVCYNAKQKEEKDNLGKKKKAPTKQQVRVTTKDDDFEGDDFDEMNDFM
eukprot:TRINITY_DN907_c0_g1::TRINITY_DN907_c0_g1_i1::g.16083::m.16083 TRINITY_DN907_c0_g1::TRINITY_DN907_c0_g1_i1::g.16083  ORF type:complete len:269 (-),score=115.41,sp/Q54KI0/EIF3J_DICDI/30.63/6e-10,eIF3_subunit/PF08597.5/1.2e-36 TRINITY_DN907_c0_g1_i1:917-1633(-)